MIKQKKYKVLIVDDEPIISDGLKLLLEDVFCEVFQVFNCYNPQKAIEIFKYRMPDIVISDIKMPKMTGIDMVKIMREIKDIHVLFLSGYEEFDYVYSAIKQEAVDYILKTEDDTVIIGALRKMLDHIEEDNLFLNKYQAVQSKINYMEPAFKQQTLCYILDGIISSQEEFDFAVSDLLLPIPKETGLYLIIGICKERIPKKEQEGILATVEQMLMNIYSVKIQTFHSVIYRNNFVWVLEAEEEELPKLLFLSMMDIQSKILKSINRAIYFGITTEAVKWYELSMKYNELWTYLNRCGVNEENSVVLANTKQNNSFNGEDVKLIELYGVMAEKIKLLKEQLIIENFTSYKKMQNEILFYLHSAQRHSMYALEIYNSIANILISYINKTNIRAELASTIQLIELFDSGAFYNWEEASNYLNELINAIEKIRNLSNHNNMISITEETKAYIIAHLSEDLSLTVIGQVLGFSPVYLSRVFKQIEKVSIREYIENTRMELAMQLIKNSRMKIYGVAEKCGYQNTAYFIKIFKSHYNVTPQDCRDSGK